MTTWPWMLSTLNRHDNPPRKLPSDESEDSSYQCDGFPDVYLSKIYMWKSVWWVAAGWQIGAVSSAVSILTAVIDAPQILVMLHLNKLAKMRITLKGGRHQVEIWKCDWQTNLPTNQLTGVGSRDACASKNIYNLSGRRIVFWCLKSLWHLKTIPNSPGAWLHCNIEITNIPKNHFDFSP